MKIKKYMAIVLATVCAAICCSCGKSINAETAPSAAGTEVYSTATSMALVDGDTGELIYSKNCDARREPASTTKNMHGDNRTRKLYVARFARAYSRQSYRR